MATVLGVRDEFINTTDGWIGAVQIGPHGEQKGIAVEPGGSVWLTEDEQILTANAPRSDADNPFTNGALELRTEGAEIKNRRPYGANAGAPPLEREAAELPADGETREVEIGETGATPQPDDEPEVGKAAEHEEVATPAARMQPKSTAGRRRRS